jgi:hypothetical protein
LFLLSEEQQSADVNAVIVVSDAGFESTIGGDTSQMIDVSHSVWGCESVDCGTVFSSECISFASTTAVFEADARLRTNGT